MFYKLVFVIETLATVNSIGKALNNGNIEIRTKLGGIVGIASTESESHKFLNVPYAEPPINELRWRPTVPLKHGWTSIYNATQFGNTCVQPFYQFGNEDCLYLNIYTSYDFNANYRKKSSLPVLLWIHGGGLVVGSAMDPRMDGGKLAKNENIIVVSINYRLGIGAWLIDPLLTDSSTGNGGANGFLDMIEALKWIQNNIESFGGNPNEITISGESGGGAAICGLVLSPLAKGLFKRSIQMSGSCIKSKLRFLTKHESYKINKQIRDNVGVQSFNDLRTMDLQTIIDTSLIFLIPSTDGYVFPMDTIDLINNGHVNGESVMIGTLFIETWGIEPYISSVLNTQPLIRGNEEDLNDFYMRNLFDVKVAQIKQYYPYKSDESIDKIWRFKYTQFDTLTEIIRAAQETDCTCRCGSIAQTEIISSHPITANSIHVYFYQFGPLYEPYDTVTHGYDVGCMFGSLAYWGQICDEQKSKITMKWIGDYVKGIHILNCDGKVATIKNNNYLQIVGTEIQVIDLNELDYIKQRCKLWDEWGHDSYLNGQICGWEGVSL